MQHKYIHYFRALILIVICGISFQVANAQTSAKASIYFKSDAADISKAGYYTLDSINYIANHMTEIHVEIYGNSDSLGSNDANMKLSEKRMLAVRTHLMANGISDAKIKGFANGAEKAKFRNSDEYNRARNRRVDVILTGKKIDKDTIVASNGVSIKIPANTFTPNFNDELNFKLEFVNDYRPMAANSISNIDSEGNRLSAGAMVFLKVTNPKDGKPIVAYQNTKEIMIKAPSKEYDAKMKAFVWDPAQHAWKGNNLSLKWIQDPTPHFEMQVSSRSFFDGNLFVCAGKPWPATNCKSPFAYRKLPSESDTTVRFLENGTVVKFDAGSFAPMPIKGVMIHLDSFATPGMMIKDSVTSLYDDGKYLPFNHLNHLSYSIYKGPKINMRPGHKAMVYYYTGDTARPTELHLGERDSTGNVRWHKASTAPKEMTDLAYTYLVFEVHKSQYIGYGDAVEMTAVTKNKNLSPAGNYQVRLAGGLKPKKIYALYPQSGVVQDLRPDAEGMLNIPAYDKASSVKLVSIYSEAPDDYIFQSSLTRLKFDEKDAYFTLEKKDFKKVSDKKTAFDMIR